MAFHPYPTDAGLADVVVLVQDALRDRMIDPKETSHAVWHLVGFGLSHWDVHHPTVATTPPMSKAEVADKLEVLKGVHSPGGVGADPTGFPWSVVLPILFQLALEVFKKWREPNQS